ncbi:MAG: class I SAM-dependent methyltransferase [Rhodobacteraceae bacterium]|nr:class I SAM-dependent methyltransferase [Paracoccaceae bacterium]
MAKETVGCNLCGESSSFALFHGSDRRHPLPGIFTMIRCRACGHVYLSPRPAPSSIGMYYPDTYSPYTRQPGWLGIATRWMRRREARSLSRLVAPGAHVLEVGCASGDLLRELRACGLHASGVEFNARVAADAREHHGLDITAGTVADVTGEAVFDMVVMRNVIEHVPSPRDDIHHIRGLLGPNGLLLLSTDNLDSWDRRVFGPCWYGYDMPRHFNLFSPQSLERLLNAEHFTVERVSFSLVPTHWLVSSRYWLEDRGLKGRWLEFLLSSRNLPAVAALLPLTFVQRLARTGGRMSLLARKAA